MAEKTDRYLVRTIQELSFEDPLVLNLPAGSGELCRKIATAGIRLTSADLFPEFSRFKPEAVVKMDMNDHFPFADDHFDVVVCQEGIEHLEDVAGFLRECSRVMRDGGVLLVTTPNFMDLSSRLSFFLTGLKSFHGDLPNEEATLWGVADERFYHGHAFTLPFFEIRYLMRISQFDQITLKSLKNSGTSSLLYCLLRPFMGMMLGRALRRRSRRDRGDSRPHASPDMIDQLCAQALSRELLCAKRICIQATLQRGSFVPVDHGI